MNLADAIRHAAKSGETFTTSRPRIVHESVALSSHLHGSKKAVTENVRENDSTTGKGERREVNLDDLSAAANAATAFPVKFELHLTAEQLTGLILEAVKTQDCVMTLRETARYLRIPGRRLEEMAQLGQIPAFLVDGNLRFARNSVDEWLAQRPFRKEMEA